MTSVILVDTSGSMERFVGSQRRIDVLSSIVQNVLPSAPAGTRLFSFNSIVTELHGAEHLPEPCGSTDVALALATIEPLSPHRLIVISDGEPDDRRAALAAADRLHATIDTFFAGDEADRAAVAFLRDLALRSKGGVGRVRIGNLAKPEQLTHAIHGLLAGPAR